MNQRLAGGVQSAGVRATAITLLLACFYLGSTSATPPAAADTPTADPSADPSASASVDGSAEIAEAKSSGSPVVVEEWTTETTEVSALPSGAFQASISSTPVRERDGSEWVALDPTLERKADGTVGPAEAIGEISLSGGGDANSLLATMTNEGVTTTIRTPFDLPAPTLHDDTAVYSEVLPGVDLVTTATTTGFTFNWVIKNRAAADDPRVRKLSLPIELGGVTAQPERGGYSFEDADGLSRFWTPTPTMWDSSGAESIDSGTAQSGETPLEAVEQGPDMEDQVSSVTTTISNGRMTLTPDPTLLDAPDVVFPVVVDPYLTYPKTRNGWTAVWNNFPSKSFWQTDHSLGAGYEGFEQMKIVRSYFRFDTSGIRGKKILAAELNVRQIHAASCQARPTDVYRTGAIGTGTTWNNQPTRYTYQSSDSSTTGCGTGTGMVGWNILNGATTLANTNASSGTFMIRARDEGDKIAWKQFDDSNANIEVTYVSKPAMPSGNSLKASNIAVPCGTSTAPAMIGSTSVTIGAKVTSADGNSASLRAIFRRRNVTDQVDLADTAGTSGVSGTTSTLTWTVQNGKTYRFFAKTRVYWTFNGVADSLDSEWNTTSVCYFKVDTTSPPPPRADTTDFAECATAESPDECSPTGQAGVPGVFTIKAANLDGTDSTDASAYKWRFNGGTTTTVTTDNGAARTVSVTPNALVNTFTAWSVDKAGNLSLPRTFLFKVAPRALGVQWTYDDAGALGADTGQAQNAPLSTSGMSAAPRGRVGGAIALSNGGFATSPITSTSGVSATSNFSISTWVRLTSPAQGTTTTILAATFTQGNVFEFGYEPSTNAWTAGRRSATSVTLARSSTASLYSWTHLAATYETSTKTLKFYVNGQLVDSEVYPSAAWVSSYWQIGCGNLGGVASSCMGGSVDDTTLYQAVLAADEIQELADPRTASEGVTILAGAASWSMDDDGATAAGESCFGADLTLANVSPTPFGPTLNGVNRALWLYGASSQQARSPHTVLDTSGSFTVAVNVRPTDSAAPMVIAQQTGTNRDAWTLAYEPEASGGGRWVFQRTAADMPTPTVVEVRTPIIVDVTELPTVLIATYNRRTDEIALYLNGAPFDTGREPATDAVHKLPFGSPWNARNRFEIGNGELNGASAPFKGEIERVDLFAGAMQPNQALSYKGSVPQ